MSIFVCGDLHGNYKALREVLRKSSFNAKEDTLITLGDYIDGGLHIQVKELMQFLLTLPNWIGIIGNHDYWLLENINAGWKQMVDDNWYFQGGRSTLHSLEIPTKIEGATVQFLDVLPDYVRTFCESLKYHHTDQFNNLYVHAGYDDLIGLPEDGHEVDPDVLYALLWDRDFWANAERMSVLPFNKIFIGHTWSPYYPQLINQVWNLDSGAGFEGRLTLMNVETEEYWRSSKTPDLYPYFELR